MSQGRFEAGRRQRQAGGDDCRRLQTAAGGRRSGRGATVERGRLQGDCLGGARSPRARGHCLGRPIAGRHQHQHQQPGDALLRVLLLFLLSRARGDPARESERERGRYPTFPTNDTARTEKADAARPERRLSWSLKRSSGAPAATWQAPRPRPRPGATQSPWPQCLEPVQSGAFSSRCALQQGFAT